ncbi:hypothetical protein [Aeromonas dhakensis]|uniref:hypothetical protein n=1 Tax=Aeromonas dhakensis TaxID=196024 RepID=UPI0019202785|nr:hypothetical protein [Aeromonas dhakensis]MBL0635698.1 hypothetical protein [Aeromonas dhakensis]HDZ8881024.1 hypothetical protein [Aeromonas dhakensis]
MLETGDKAGTPLYGASEKSTLVFGYIHLSRQSQRWRGLRKGSNDAFLPHKNGPEKGWHEAIHPIWVKQIWLYREAGGGVP